MKSPEDVVIISGKRTPFVKAGGDFRDIHPVRLAQVSLTETLASCGFLPENVDEVIIGNAGNPSDSMNIARVIALRAGLPQSVSAFTVHRNCASGLESLATAYDKILSGSAEVVVAGGAENMTQLPLLFPKEFSDVFGRFLAAKTPIKKLQAICKLRIKHFKPRIAVLEGLTDPFKGILMGDTAEILAKRFGIKREEQDAFALGSHKKAIQAQEMKRFENEIVPLFTSKGFVEKDIGPRGEQTIKKLGKLRPYFDRKNGTVTVGNSCPITDGAGTVLMMKRKKAKELDCPILAKLRGYSFAGLEPECMGLGPVYATAKLFKKENLRLKDMGAIELNEAFAAQVLSCKKAFESDEFARENLGLSEKMGELREDLLNEKGGAIALGHPIGATGTRLVITLIQTMKDRKCELGLATLCIGGGQGGAMVLENE